MVMVLAILTTCPHCLFMLGLFSLFILGIGNGNHRFLRDGETRSDRAEGRTNIIYYN